MFSNFIKIRGAREHNLRGLDLDLPKNRLIVFTGISGSGKSSLAFDTLFAEGQRLYVESLSPYARQFMRQLPRPRVDRIEGLQPAIAIEQGVRGHNPRSTVATLTEIHDYLRVLYATVAQPHCPQCGQPLQAQSRQAILAQIRALNRETAVQILAPVVVSRRGQFKDLFADLQRRGFARARVDGEMIRLEDPPLLDRYRRHNIELVVDRLPVRTQEPGRLAEAVDTALDSGQGDLLTWLPGDEEVPFSRNFSCPRCSVSVPEMTPASFSFNSPRGMCRTCEGLGVTKQIDPQRLVEHPERSLEDGAIPLLSRIVRRRDWHWLEGVADHFGFTLDTPWKELGKQQREVLLQGSEEQLEYCYRHPRHGWEWRHAGPWEGLLAWFVRRYKRTTGGPLHLALDRTIREQLCPDCQGQRLCPEALAFRLGDQSLAEVLALSVTQAREFFATLKLDPTRRQIAEEPLGEINQRLEFLEHVGLHYLTLDRTAPTLSGGEAQRLRLASQVGSGLTDCLYVLDEPSIGLHHRDQGQLIEALQHLRDQDNTILVAEHDEQTILSADWVVDFGPGAGERGGEIVFQGTPGRIKRTGTLTGQYLSGRRTIPLPASRRCGNGQRLILRGARQNNLKDLTVEFPLGRYICVTGVSGSGKSSLVSDTLYPALARHLHHAQMVGGQYEALQGLEHLDKVVMIDQSPIGRTPRSNPATYTGVFTPLRELYAQLPQARARGYQPGRFSFNVAAGRCPECDGYGAVHLEADFLAEVWVPCERCGGRRFDRETLEITYHGANIAEVLEMEVREAREHFRNLPKITRILQTLVEVGLGYIKLGQPATTLSGGEAQRVKLAKELARPRTGHCLYLLDEPTVGLHFEDVRHLLEVVQRFVDEGNTVVIVEHHPDLIKCADYVIDLGPEGGETGGEIVVAGTPEEVAQCEQSYTGELLRQVLSGRGNGIRPVGRQRRSSRARTNSLVVRGARQHNLQNLDVALPRHRFVTLAGVSGSGKTSLALDTIYAEGQRRFVASLSPYARQFVNQMPKPQVEHVSGLSPAIAVESRNSIQTPRSTVGTVTQIYDYLRVLYARVGCQYCPDCGLSLGAASVDEVVDRLLAGFAAQPLLLLAPLRPTGSEEYQGLLATAQREGWTRIWVDGEQHRLPLDFELDRRRHHEVAVIVDRLSPAASQRARLAEAVEAAFELSAGYLQVRLADKPQAEPTTFGTELSCPRCGMAYDRLAPRRYSFNHPEGWCPRCLGLGTVEGVDPRALVPDESKSLATGAVSLWGPLEPGSLLHTYIQALARHLRFRLDRPWQDLYPRQRQALLEGVEEPIPLPEGGFFDFSGIREAVREAAGQGGEFRQRYARAWTQVTCPECSGARLHPEAAATRFRGLILPKLCHWPLDQILHFLEKLRLTAAEQERAEEIVQEIHERLRLLVEMGLDYLTLDRAGPTLSGGEAQRVNLAGQLGSGLTGVLYMLDEPTVGVHPQDNERMLGALRRLHDLGNSLLVVEHDLQTLRFSDYVLEFGPGAGVAGGRIVARGEPQKLARLGSLTGDYLAGRRAVPMPKDRRPPWRDNQGELQILGAREHNLRNLDVRIPLGRLVCVTGPSGSGKSTLISEILYPELLWRLRGRATSPGQHREIQGTEHLRQVVNLEQSPIGQSPRSNPATYGGAFDLIRQFYAQLPEARRRGYTAGRFSFNRPGGRCQTCEGLGARHVEMHFLPDVWVTCEECQGRRYQPEILEIEYQGKTIADLLELTVAEARDLFSEFPALYYLLETMCQVGLDYLPLGQAAPSLSGGEAQRVKLARELVRPLGPQCLYLLDEPTTGLHPEDITRLLRVLHTLVEQGNTVLIIEHNLEVIKNADYVIDLGPGGGDQGGHLVARGTPEQVARNQRSATAPYLAEALAGTPRLPWEQLLAELPRRIGRATLAQPEDQTTAPWQRDPWAWHEQRELAANGQARAWDARLLPELRQQLARLEPAPVQDAEHPDRIEVRLAGAKLPFLIMRTHKPWYLDLQFRLQKGQFDERDLAAALAWPTWNEIEGLPHYGEGARVRVYTRAADYDRVALQAYARQEVQSDTFCRFLNDFYQAYLRLVGAEEKNA